MAVARVVSVTVNLIVVSHGGVAVIAERGTHLSKVDLGAVPTTFEHLCVRVTSGSSSCVVLLLYRPGSASVTNDFLSASLYFSKRGAY